MSTPIEVKSVKSFTERFHWLRKSKLGFTFAALSSDTGLSASYLNEIEKGRKRLPEKLCEYFYSTHGVNLHWLITGEGSPFGEMAERNNQPPPVLPPAYMTRSRLNKGEVPTKEDFYKYIDKFFETAEGDKESIRWAYRRLRDYLPFNLVGEQPQQRRYADIIKASSLLANSTYPEDEAQSQVLFDTLLRFATSKAFDFDQRDNDNEYVQARDQILGDIVSKYEDDLARKQQEVQDPKPT